MAGLSSTFLEVPALVKRYGLTTFIETGAEDGYSLAVAYGLSLDLHTCDVDAEKVEKCRRIFPVAQIHHARSVDFLREHAPNIGGPALIWLDAHFSPLMPRSPGEQWPLRDELAILAERYPHIASSVVLCDDITTVLQRSLTSYDLDVPQGHPDFVDYPLRAIVDLLPGHDWEIIERETGILRFTPKARPLDDQALAVVS